MRHFSNALIAAAGSAGGAGLAVEDVISTYLYTGNGTSQTINNGIDLDGEGGLVWIKARTNGVTANHSLFDTERGIYKWLRSNLTSAELSYSNTVTAFNEDGFDLGVNNQQNYSGEDYASWTFRKAEKFFDVVTYTGSAATQNIAHNLGSTPGMIIIKRTDTGPSDWIVYHQGLNNGTDPEDYYLILNGTASENNAWIFNKTAPTDTTFTVGGGTGNVNTSGGTYVAYLFASDAGGFGDDGSESIIKCGSYTGNGTSGHLIDIGFEPQWVLIKRTDASTPWYLADSMRNMANKGASNIPSNYLFPNESWSEEYIRNNYQGTHHIEAKPNGFAINPSENDLNRNGNNYIYIAIRRPMKTPESGTEVFALQDPGYPVDSNGLAFTSNFPVDLALLKERTNSTDGWYTMSRMQGSGNFMKTNSTAAESSGVTYGTFDHNTGWYSTASASMSWMFKRATGFFDVVAYTAAGSPLTENHNLGVAPEAIIVKKRSGAANWTWSSGFGGTLVQMEVNTTNASSASDGYIDSVTSTTFTTGGSGAVISSGTYIAYLFATLAGVSKVGSYTGTGNSLDIDCGFSNGARFVMIKRTDSSSDWWVWDTARGIVSGNDPTLRLNSTAAETTTADYIDPLSSGFTLTTAGNWLYGMNYPSGNYIFLAIA